MSYAISIIRRPTPKDRSSDDTALVNETIKKELAAVEQLFTDELGTDLPCVNTLIKHVSRFRGKMLRPT
jgi:hypothetical protein